MKRRDIATMWCKSRLNRPTRFAPLALLLASALLAGCASERRDLKLAESAVDLFHSQFDSGKYSAICDGADYPAKNAAREAACATFLQSVHQSLGTVQDSALKGITFQLAQHVIRLDYSTTFTRETASETFLWQITNGQAILRGYNISSRDFPGTDNPMAIHRRSWRPI
jgi:hypothetical protein